MDNWAVGKEKVCYWLSNDIVGLVGNLANLICQFLDQFLSKVYSHNNVCEVY